MNKLFWLTTFACCICIVSAAQQVADSATNQQLQAVGSSSIFSNFTYNSKDFNKVLLQWAIDSADNNDYFVVERSRDTVHFETLGILKRIGAVTQYELTDNNALSGFNYYRIKIPILCRVFFRHHRIKIFIAILIFINIFLSTSFVFVRN